MQRRSVELKKPKQIKKNWEAEEATKQKELDLQIAEINRSIKADEPEVQRQFKEIELKLAQADKECRVKEAEEATMQKDKEAKIATAKAKEKEEERRQLEAKANNLLSNNQQHQEGNINENFENSQESEIPLQVRKKAPWTPLHCRVSDY